MSDTANILTDYEKVSIWADLGETNGWVKPQTLGAWLSRKNIYFTYGGSAVVEDVLIEKIPDKASVDSLFRNFEKWFIYDFTLKFLTGVTVGGSTEIEVYFWRKLQENMGINTFPTELIPGYIQYAMKEYYPNST